MSLLSELSAIAKKLKIPAQTSVYSGNAPDEYLVFTPPHPRPPPKKPLKRCTTCWCLLAHTGCGARIMPSVA